MELEEFAGILNEKDSVYYLMKQIGTGATSYVYLCLDKENKEFAAKLYTDNLAYHTEVDRFNQLVYSKNIVKLVKSGTGFVERGCSLDSYEITEHFNNKEVNFALFEYLPNGELFQYIFIPKQEPFPEKIAKKIFVDLVDAAEACHKSNIAHGDIKPENILLSHDFQIKLIDFGFSKIIDDNLINDYAGTPCYSSPEFNMGDKGYDGVKNDIFSLGVVLFALIMAQLPFDHSNMSDQRYKFIIKGDYTGFWKMFKCDHISSSLKDLINKILCFDPRERISIVEIKNHPWICSSSNLSNLLYEESVVIGESHDEVDDVYQKEFINRKKIIDEYIKEEENEIL